MSLDDAERDDMGVENPLGIGLEDSGKDDVKEKNPHDQLTVAAALSCIAGRDRFADVYFAVGTGKEQRRIPGHRVILAAASDIFEAMLYPTVFPDDLKAKGGGAGGDKDVKGDAAAAPASAAASAAGAGAGAGAAVPLPAMGLGLGLGVGFDDPNAEIEVPDVKPHVFRCMLSSIYGDSAEIKAEDLPELIACARKFQVESLRLQCVTFMTEGVTVDNACGLFESAEKLLNEKQFALQFIEDNAAEVLAHPSFDALSRERVATILRSNKLAIDEIDLFKALLRWSVAECKRQGVKEKDLVEAKKKCVAELIPLVRFPLMAMEDVATLVSPSNILTPPQLLEVFTYLGQPDSRKPKTQFNAQPRVGNSDKWTFEPAANLHSASITFSGAGAGKNLTAKNNSINHSYCLGSVAWTKGAHAWRVTRDQGQTQWLLLGVSRKEAHADSSSTAGGFYGMSSANQRFMAGAQAYVNSNFMTGPLDVLYDADAGSLAIFNHSNGQRFDMNGIPKGQPLCPHFGPHSNQQLTVKPIRPKDFARK